MGPPAVVGAPAIAPLVHFPADQAAHSRVQNEWWYVVGHVRSGKRTFGYELTIFKFHNLRLPGMSSPISLFRTDVAITDESAHRFHHAVSYYFPSMGRVSSRALSVKVGNASLAGSPAAMSLRGSLAGGSIALRLRSLRAPMYVGGRGYMSMGDGYTYYYSLTDLATTGTLRVGGRVFTVIGTSWLDHQWGDWRWTSIRGWTWMALQLSNGVQLSVFDFRSTGPRVRAASVLARDGTLHTVLGITITPTGSWTSPHTHARYPSGWVVTIPAMHARLRISPTVKDQEVVSREAGHLSAYWEGSGRISATWRGASVTGASYTELTGFAGKFIS